jgi:hypothetical protein
MSLRDDAFRRSNLQQHEIVSGKKTYLPWRAICQGERPRNDKINGWHSMLEMFAGG